MFAELELEYLVKLRPGNMGLEVWGKSAQNVSRRTIGLLAGSLVTAGLLYLFFRDKVSSYQLYRIFKYINPRISTNHTKMKKKCPFVR